MTYLRFKKPTVINEEAQRESTYIVEDFAEYVTGVRCIYLMHRTKEGGATNHNRRQIKAITKDSKEFQEVLAEYLTIKKSSDEPYRIYSAANERDMKKAISKFKFEQLQADDYGVDEREAFYTDIKNRFHGCLMQPSSKKTSYFIVDCDSTESFQDAQIELSKLEVVIKKQYKTKNGWHIITEPFNPNLFKVKETEIKTDGLILLSY